MVGFAFPHPLTTGIFVVLGTLAFVGLPLVVNLPGCCFGAAQVLDILPCRFFLVRHTWHTFFHHLSGFFHAAAPLQGIGKVELVELMGSLPLLGLNRQGCCWPAATPLVLIKPFKLHLCWACSVCLPVEFAEDWTDSRSTGSSSLKPYIHCGDDVPCYLVEVRPEYRRSEQRSCRRDR